MSASDKISLNRKLYNWEEAVLKEADLFLVGGVVRDILRGSRDESLDDDYIVTGLEMEKLVSVLDNFGKTNLVGRSFGIIKFITQSGKAIDISLPRTEFSTGRGHRDFTIHYDPDLPIEEDLKRRDFTINSIAVHIGSGEIIDPLGGRRDIDSGLLRVNNENSFLEDPLRILRGIQFVTRFQLQIDSETEALMKKFASTIESVSFERIRDELNKMILSKGAGDGFVIMHDIGLLKYIIPELEETYGVLQNEFHRDDLFYHSIKSCNEAKSDLVIKWSALLHDIGKKNMKREINGRVVFYRHEEEGAILAGKILKRLRYSKEIIKRVVHLVRNHMFQITDEFSNGAIRRFIRKVGEENLEAIFSLREADIASREEPVMMKELEWTRERVKEILKLDSAIKRTDLEIDGNDVKNILKIDDGPKIGEVLERILEMVMEEPQLNSREKLIEILRTMKK